VKLAKQASHAVTDLFQGICLDDTGSRSFELACFRDCEDWIKRTAHISGEAKEDTCPVEYHLVGSNSGVHRSM